MSATFERFAAERPELAAEVRARLHGRTAYLATVRADGQPRVHPVTPDIDGHDLFLFMEPTSPKGQDLRRGSGYALHCGVEDSAGGGGEVLVSGQAVPNEQPEVRARAVAASPYVPADRYVLFVLLLDDVMVRRYDGPDGRPVTHRWRAG